MKMKMKRASGLVNCHEIPLLILLLLLLLLLQQSRFLNVNIPLPNQMCPLRLILVFLSATLAGFFVLRNLKSQPQLPTDDAVDSTTANDSTTATRFSKVRLRMQSGFWTFVDMASGKYLWRHLVSSSSSSSKRSV